jgi:hypothetical protein
MKRTVGVCVVLAALGGCVTLDENSDSNPCMSGRCYTGYAPSVPGVQGPWGQPVPVAGPYMGAPGSEAAARAMMSQSVPLDLVQGTMPPGMMGGGLVQANCPPGGCPPGMAGGPPIAGAVAGVGALTGGMPPRFPTKRTEVRFVAPRGMKIAWYAPTGAGKSGFAGTQLEVPGRYNFVQAAIYRLKLSDIPGRPGVYFYPTLEVVPSNAKTDPFLAHTAVPISFNDEDINQVLMGNYIIKVIYLPDPQFQDLAATGTGEIVSSLLEPGVDPIAEAHRRGNILCIVRMGNIDLEAPDSPAMDAPSAYQPKLPPPPPQMPQMPQGMNPGMPGGRPMVPYGMMGPNGPMMPQGNPMQGPGGQMMPPGMPMMGPGGQMMPPGMPMQGAGGQMMPPGMPMMGPNGPMMPPPGMMPGMQGMQPGAQLPPTPDQPSVVQVLPPANGNGAPAGQQVQYMTSPSDPSTQGQASSTTPSKTTNKSRAWWRNN